MHSAAAIVNGQGLVFVGHSSAGKSTTMELLKAARDLPGLQDLEGLSVEILCDDRNVIRKWDAPVIASRPERNEVESKGAAKQSPASELEIASSRKPLLAMTDGEWRVHGTWSHGTTADVSSASAPLRAILFLQQSQYNEIVPLDDRKEIWRRLLATLIRPMVTAEWWQKELDVLEQIVKEVRCYSMKFDKSGAIVAQLVALTNDE
jgi:hypothetical protein